MDSAITEEASIRDAESILRDKGLYRELRTLASEIGETGADATERKERFQAFGWELEHTYSIGNNRPRFDAFKNRVGVEYERREQMSPVTSPDDGGSLSAELDRCRCFHHPIGKGCFGESHGE